MTGRELIIYILQNKLEDKQVFDSNGVFVGFMGVGQVANKFNVGTETVVAWYTCGLIPGYDASGTIIIPANVEDPRPKILKSAKTYLYKGDTKR